MASLSVTGSSYKSKQRARNHAGTKDNTGPRIVELLEKCFSDDRHRKERELAEGSGWRTLVFVARTLGIPRSRVYGDKKQSGFFSQTLGTLIETGKVESRIFPGERGRGGSIVKVRVKRDQARQLGR